MAKSFKNDTGVRIKGGLAGAAQMREALQLLSQLEVLVGVPAANADEGRESGEPSNAQLAYIHDNGAPEANIPARPFMRPGIESARGPITEKLSQTMRAVLRGGGMEKVEQGLTQVGIVAAVAVQSFINEGVPPPLAEATLRARMRKGRRGGGGARQGAAQELDRRWDGQAPSVEFAKPLVDTAAMRNSITYAIRPKGATKRR